MKTEVQAARRYARALFEFCEARGETGSALADLRSLEALFSSTPSLPLFLRHPRNLETPAGKAILARLQESASEPMGRLLRILIHRGRLAVLPCLSAEFFRLQAEKERRLEVRVVSAHELTPEQLDRIRTKIAAKNEGRQIELTTSVDPSLLAGFRVEAGDTVLEADLRRRLSQLKKFLTARV